MSHNPTAPPGDPEPPGTPSAEVNVSGAFLARVIGLVDAAIYVFDLVEQRVVFGNTALLRLYGIEEGDVVDGALFAERLHPADHAVAGARLDRLRHMPDGEWLEWEHRFRHVDGSYRWLVARDTVFTRAEGGAVTQIIGTAHDITDRKLAEEHERRERARAAVYGVFARALAATGDEEPTLLRGLVAELAERLTVGCVLALEEDGGPYVRAVAWHHRDERVIAALDDLFQRDPWTRHTPPLARIFQGEAQLLTPDFIERVRTTDAYTWQTLDALGLVEAAIVPLWSHDDVFGALCLMRFSDEGLHLTDDLTFLNQMADSVALAIVNGRLLGRLRRELAERRRAEEELRRSRDLLRGIFEGLEEALLLLAGDGTVLAANRRFAELCELSLDGLVGLRWAERPEWAAPFLPADRFEAGGPGPQGRQRLRAADASGRVRMLDLYTLPLQGMGADDERLLVRVVDVTEQVQIEARIIAGERLAANERLAATVAHEVNTPLQAIESSLHLAGKLSDEQQRASYLRLAREEILRVGQILRQLLDLHRPQTEPIPFNVNDLVERVLLLSGGSLRRSGIQLRRELADGLPTVVGRTDELTQVLLNLVFNAIQVMPRGGQLLLRTEYRRAGAEPAAVVVRVQDNGPGVDPALGEQIFEPFFTTREGGTGLGLAVSRQIVAQHNGRLWLESVPGNGASFLIELPAPAVEG